MAWYMGDTRAALDLNRLTQAEPDVQADPRRLGRLLDHESWYVYEAGDLERARELAIAAARTIPADPPSSERALAIGTLGARALSVGRTGEARALFEEGLAIGRSIDDLPAVTSNLTFVAMAYADLGPAEAMVAIEEADPCCRRRSSRTTSSP